MTIAFLVGAAARGPMISTTTTWVKPRLGSLHGDSSEHYDTWTAGSGFSVPSLSRHVVRASPVGQQVMSLGRYQDSFTVIEPLSKRGSDNSGTCDESCRIVVELISPTSSSAPFRTVTTAYPNAS